MIKSPITRLEKIKIGQLSSEMGLVGSCARKRNADADKAEMPKEKLQKEGEKGCSKFQTSSRARKISCRRP